MRIDYRHYREPAFIWSCSGRRDAQPRRGAVHAAGATTRAAGSRSEAWAFSRRSRPSWRPSSSSPRCSSGACTASTSVRYCAAARSAVVVRLGGPRSSLEPDLRHVRGDRLLIAGVMVFAAGLNYAYVVGRRRSARPFRSVGLLVALSGYRLQRVLTFLHPWDDPLGDGLSDHSVASSPSARAALPGAA